LDQLGRKSIRPPAWVLGRYLILYRAKANRVEIVRVVHGARDLDQITF
jgi:plasmid stabilization system protein ParE